MISSRSKLSRRILELLSPEEDGDIGHVFRKDNTKMAGISMCWTPEGKRNRGRPKTTWCRTVETDLRELNHSWSTRERLARDRQGWRDLVVALCAACLTNPSQ